MKTKQEVMKCVEDELYSHNTIIISTIGDGGSGLSEFSEDDAESIDAFLSELDGYRFEGLASDIDNIQVSQFYEPEYEVYQFDMGVGGDNPTKMQIAILDASRV